MRNGREFQAVWERREALVAEGRGLYLGRRTQNHLRVRGETEQALLIIQLGPGFKPGFKGAERRSSFRRDSRWGSQGSFVRNVDSKAVGVRDGHFFQPRDREGFRRGGERTEAGTEGQEKVLNPRGNAHPTAIEVILI